MDSAARAGAVLAHLDERSKLGELRARYFAGNASGLATFLATLFPVGEKWVILGHQGAFVDWWGMLMFKLRIHATVNGPMAVCVRYTRKFAQINGTLATGDVYYPLERIVELVAYMLVSSTGDMPNAQRFSSAFDVPLMLISTLLHPCTPEALYDAFCRDWVDLGAHDARYVQLYRERPDVLRQFYAEPLDQSSNSGTVMMRDYERLLRANKLGEWWARQRRCAGTSLTVTLYTLFDLECERLLLAGLSADELRATRVSRLQQLFPFALALALDTTPGDDERAVALVEGAPTVAAMIQAFVDAARVFMCDQPGGGSDARANGSAPGRTYVNGFHDGTWSHAQLACTTLRNIRTCIDPQIEAMERFENASWEQAAADANTRDGRSQRMMFHAAQRQSLYDFVYDTLCDELNNVIEMSAVLVWVQSEAFHVSRAISPPSCTRNDVIHRPRSENVRKMVRAVSARFVVLSFFGQDEWPPASLFSLRCTMKALETQFPEIGLADHSSHFMGHCHHGPYLVLERQVLWMVVHGAATLAMMSQQRCFQKVTPHYPEMLRTYFSRMDTDDARSYHLRATPSAWSCLWVQDSSWSTPPATLNPNIFSHMCFVNTLCEWLDIPVEVVGGHKWRLAVPPPETPAFAITRMLHRFVDQLYQGAVSELIAAGMGNYQYWLDDDDLALNAIKAFLQMDAPHTISVYMLQCLLGTCADAPQGRFGELEAILALLEPGSAECRRDINAWITSIDRRHRHAVAMFGNSNNGSVTDGEMASVSAPRKRRRPAKRSFLDELLIEGSTPLGVQTPSSQSSLLLLPQPTTPAVAGVPKARRRTEAQNMDIGVERERTDRATAEMLLADELDNVDEDTREYVSMRVAILPTEKLIAALHPSHSLHRLWRQGADPRRLLAHMNLLFYEPLLCNRMPLRDARRLACDFQVGGPRIAGNTLFAERRYSGDRDEALLNFREMHANWESAILNVQNDPTGRVLAYTPNEPRDQLYTLFRHLDYRHTLGDTSPGHGINVAIDTLMAQSAPAERLLAPASTCVAIAPSSAVSSSSSSSSTQPSSSSVPAPTGLSAELPSCMYSARRHLYPSNSMVLITTIGEAHLAEHIASSSRRWEAASHIAGVVNIDARARTLQTQKHVAGHWLRTIKAKLADRAEKNAAEEARIEAASRNFDTAMVFLGLH